MFTALLTGVAWGEETQPVAAIAPTGFLDEYPGLKEHIFEEPKSNLYFGFGLSPFSFLKNKYYFGGSFLQIHWIHSSFDLELLNASIAFTFPQESYAKSRHFTLRSAPKIRLFDGLSIGPVIGMEFVSFPEVQARIVKDNFATLFDQFSSSGMVYGLAVSETMRLSGDRLFKINQVVMSQTYSTSDASSGWRYSYELESVESDPEKTLIKPNVLFMLEFSYLF